MAIDKPKEVAPIPPLMSNKPVTAQGRLLRKPRLPTVAPQPPPTPPASHDAQAIIELAEQSRGATTVSDTKYAENYREYTYVPGASPPPPSEFSAPLKTPLSSTPPPSRSKELHSRSKVRSSEAKYVIDPVYRQNTNLGTYVEGQSLVKPYRPRGPMPLPAREPLRQSAPSYYLAGLPDMDEQERYFEQPEFSLQDFLVRISEEERVPLERVQQVVYSRHNYKKIQQILMQMFIHPRRQRRVATVNMHIPDEVAKTTPRVPQKQLVIEMAALIKEQMSAVMQSDMRPVIRPLPKYSPYYKPGEPRPHTEIVLYEEGKKKEATEISIKIQPDVSQYSARESLFHSATARYFQGSMRSNSPFDAEPAVRNTRVANPSKASIDMVARVNTAELFVHSPTRVLHLDATDRRQPHIIDFGHVELPYSPPRPHLWHRMSRENISMLSSHSATVTSHFNTLVGDATPRAVVTAEQNLGTVSRSGLLPASWEHHTVLPDIQEGVGDSYKLAGSHSLNNRSRLFLYRQDESTISDAGSSTVNADPPVTADPGDVTQAALFLSREHTEVIMSEAEKTLVSERELREDEIAVYGENVVKAVQRQRRKKAKMDADAVSNAVSSMKRDSSDAPLKEVSFAANSQLIEHSLESPRRVKIVNVEFPRFSHSTSTAYSKATDQKDDDNKAKTAFGDVIIQEQSLTPANTFASLVPKQGTPVTPGNLRIETRVEARLEGKEVHTVDIQGVEPGSMEQLVAFGSVVAAHKDSAAEDDNVISPSELAILDSLMNGGVALSLKAHFIHELPDIEPLIKTLTYVNLSFNDFRAIPLEIFDLDQLQTLKLRNNPIRELPPEIARLRNLKTLILSFCLVTNLPMALFRLKKLEHLDIAYNKISFIPSEIKQLKILRELNAEGNQLAAMPVGMLRLRHLRYLRVRNNFMHPLFWKDNAKNNPQRLGDMAAQTFKSYQLDQLFTKLPDKVNNILKTAAKCDCCGGVLYGDGLRMIRPVSKIFGIKNLPFMFRSCSPYCYSKFASSSDSLMEQLYGTAGQ